jgi:transposase
MGWIHLTDGQWAFIQPLLPPHARIGRLRAYDRRTIEGILYVFIDGPPLDMPRCERSRGHLITIRRSFSVFACVEDVCGRSHKAARAEAFYFIEMVQCCSLDKY